MVKNAAYFRAAWQNAVALCVMLCQMYGLTEKDILCHSEGHKQGIANNHADVMHWFPRHGENMDTFRAAVQATLAGEVPTVISVPPPTPPDELELPVDGNYLQYTVQPGDTLWHIARDKLGTGTRYREIMALNNLSSDAIRTGQILKMPE